MCLIHSSGWRDEISRVFRFWFRANDTLDCICPSAQPGQISLVQPAMQPKAGRAKQQTSTYVRNSTWSNSTLALVLAKIRHRWSSVACSSSMTRSLCRHGGFMFSSLLALGYIIIRLRRVLEHHRLTDHARFELFMSSAHSWDCLVLSL